MPEPRKPQVVVIYPDGALLIECPGCGTLGKIDKDQASGRVSIQCPLCGYHETHNLLEAEE